MNHVRFFLLPWQSSYSAMRGNRVTCSLHLSQSYFAAHISSMWTRWISHFGCTQIGKQKICVTCERKKQIRDLFLFISLRCVSALFACFSLFWGKFAWIGYKFTFKQNNCTKASVTSLPPSVCLLMPRVVSKTKAVQKKSRPWIQYLGGRKHGACQNMCAAWKMDCFQAVKEAGKGEDR